MARHARRVDRAVADLERELERPGPPLVIVGEGTLDRGAVDAVILRLALGPDGRAGATLPRRIDLVDGMIDAVPASACPDGVPTLGAAGERFLLWDDEGDALHTLDDPTARGTALRRRSTNVEPDRVVAVCLSGVLVGTGSPRLAHLLYDRDLTPTRILPLVDSLLP